MAKLTTLVDFNWIFFRCENVKHGITSEILFWSNSLNFDLQLDLIRGDGISSNISEALCIGTLLTGALMIV